MNTRSERIAKQLQDLMDRRKIENAAQFERITIEKKVPVDQVSIRRILKQELKTKPDSDTLRKLCLATGEDYDVAFPDGDQVVVAIGGRPVAIKSLDGEPLDERLLTRLGGIMMLAAVSRDPTRSSFAPGLVDDDAQEQLSHSRSHQVEQEDRPSGKKHARPSKKRRP